MAMEQILSEIRTYDGVLELAPEPGGEHPEISWGDHFFYYAPDGEVPQREQPYATIVTKDYPDEPSSGLDAPGRWRLNIHVGRERFIELTGADPKQEPVDVDHSAADVVAPHPVYRAQGWVSVVNPGERTGALVLELLREAHEAARRRAERRG